MPKLLIINQRTIYLLVLLISRQLKSSSKSFAVVCVIAFFGARVAVAVAAVPRGMQTPKWIPSRSHASPFVKSDKRSGEES